MNSGDMTAKPSGTTGRRRRERISGLPATTSRPESAPRITCSATNGPSTSTDRKSTRLNSSHLGISYAVFCLKKQEIRHRHRRAYTTHTGHARLRHPPPHGQLGWGRVSERNAQGLCHRHRRFYFFFFNHAAPPHHPPLSPPPPRPA